MKTIGAILLLVFLVCAPALAIEDVGKLTTLQNAATATGAGTEMRVRGYVSVGVQVTISGTSATVTFQGSIDGSTYDTMSCTATNGGTNTGTATATGLYQCNVGSLSYFRANITACSSCTVTVTGQPSTSFVKIPSGQLTTGYYRARDLGVTCDGTTDDTAALQAAITTAVNGTLLLPSGSCLFSTVLTIPSSSHIVGTGNGGSFGTTLRPNNSQAFAISGQAHHIKIENVMIWPKGSSPTARLIRLTNCYSVVFQDVRIHVDSTGLPPTTSAISQDNSESATGCNDVTYQRVTIRSDDGSNWFPYDMYFGVSSGDANVIDCDLETSTTGAIIHDGGRVTVVGLYSERHSVHTIWAQASTDSTASLTVVGGIIGTAASGIPVRVDGEKNFQLLGSKIERNGGTHDGYVYSLASAANIFIAPANFDYSKWGTDVALTPSIITFAGPLRPLPASKFTSINVTAGTLAAGDITGAQFVSLMSTNATPGTQTTRTAALMIADMNALPGDTYTLRITNTGAGTFTLGAGSNVTLTGTMTVAVNTFRDFVVTITSATALTIQSIGIGTYS